MKTAIAALIVLAAANALPAAAQDGSGHMPPKAPVIVLPSPLPATSPVQVLVPKLSQATSQ
jgi:hypothetical protein